MYFAGIGNTRVMNQTSILTCFCWDMCQIRFSQKLVIVGVESIAAYLLVKHFFKVEGVKSIIITILFAFVSVYVVELLYVFTELVDYHKQLEIYGIHYPMHVALGKFFVNFLILTLTLIFVKAKKKT
jgi:hypothetical protein